MARSRDPRVDQYLSYVGSGTRQASAGLEAMARSVLAAKVNFSGLNEELKTGTYTAVAREAARLTNILNVLQQQAKLVEVNMSRHRVEIGAYADLAHAVADTTHAQALLNAEQKVVDVSIARQRVAAGSYREIAAATLTATKAQQALAAEMRKVDLIVSQGRLSASLTLMAEKFQTVGRVGTYGFGLITGTLGGFVRAGMCGTAAAEAIALSVKLINREIANVFAQPIQSFAVKIQQLAGWFQSLTGEQQKAARTAALWGVSLSGALMILPRVTAAAASLATVSRVIGLGGLFGGGKAATAGGAAATGSKVAANAPGAAGLMGGMGPWGLVAAAGVGLLLASNEGRQALGNLTTALMPAIKAIGSLANTLMNVLGPALMAFSEGLGTVISKLSSYIPGASISLEQRFKQEDPEALRTVLRQGGIQRGFTFVRLSEDLRRELQEKVNRLGAEGAGKGEGKNALTAAGSGFESPVDIYRRVAEAASKGDIAGPQEQAAESLKAIEAILEGGLAGVIEGLRVRRPEA